jgi:magnesium-transporting ATPase (P-type)
MATATRDLDRAAFDPDGDLLGYVTEWQLTSLVGMVDPPRDESRDAVASAQAAHIRVRMVTGDDVTTGSAIAKQVGIGGEAILGADFAALPESERLARIDSIGVVGRVAPEHKVLLAETLKKKGEVVAMTGDGGPASRSRPPRHLFGSVQIGQSIAFTALALCLIVAAVECRSETGTALTTATFDSKQMNWAMLGEFVLAVLVTQYVARRRQETTQV